MPAEAMLNYMQTMICPFARMSHPAAHGVAAQTESWLKRCGLLSADSVSRRFAGARFARLAAAAYPFAHARGIQLAADWTAWLFLHDDTCDEALHGRTPSAVATQSEALLHTLLEGDRGESASPLEAALADLRTRMLELGGYGWIARFAGSVERYLAACLWEAQNRAQERVPDEFVYVQMRRDTGAVQTCFELIEIVDGVRIEACERAHPEFTALLELANDVICWCNDIVSAEKELRHGDVHNLCIILARESGDDLPKATRRVVHMHNERVREFQSRAARWSARSGASRHVVRVLEAWMSANHEWSFASQRYDAFDVAAAHAL